MLTACKYDSSVRQSTSSCRSSQEMNNRKAMSRVVRTYMQQNHVEPETAMHIGIQESKCV